MYGPHTPAPARICRPRVHVKSQLIKSPPSLPSPSARIHPLQEEEDGAVKAGWKVVLFPTQLHILHTSFVALPA